MVIYSYNASTVKYEQKFTKLLSDIRENRSVNSENIQKLKSQDEPPLSSTSLSSTTRECVDEGCVPYTQNNQTVFV
ncbi:unnamed protein product [Parnassius mnemosyne]|uniref:Uncharacterized protein n=1 Tax=Parnassius mnemosyne TaxID=213953 RepID=A0AAV1K8C3_9NEOP